MNSWIYGIIILATTFIPNVNPIRFGLVIVTLGFLCIIQAIEKLTETIKDKQINIQK